MTLLPPGSPERATAVVIGNRIRLRRRERGMSQGALGVHLGTSNQHVYRLERGYSRLQPNHVPALCAALEAPLSYFLGEGAPAEAAVDDLGTMLLVKYWRRLPRPLREVMLTHIKHLADITDEERRGK